MASGPDIIGLKRTGIMLVQYTVAIDFKYNFGVARDCSPWKIFLSFNSILM